MGFQRKKAAGIKTWYHASFASFSSEEDTEKQGTPPKNKKCRKRKQDVSSSSSTAHDKMEHRRTGTKRKKPRNDATPKQVVGWKFSPSMLKKLLLRFDDEQKKWVNSTGFGVLYYVCDSQLPRELTLMLINKVNHHTGALEIDGVSVPMKPFVRKLLGIPNGKSPVTAPLFTVRGKTKVMKPTAEHKEFTDLKGGRGRPIHEVLDELVNCHEELKFQKKFIVVALSIYLAPRSGYLLNRTYLECLKNMALVADMNWCDYVADFLIQGIRDYHESGAANIFVHGCVHILVLMYIDLLEGPVPDHTLQFPRIQACTPEVLKQLDSIHPTAQARYRSLNEFTTLYGMDMADLDVPVRAQPVPCPEFTQQSADLPETTGPQQHASRQPGRHDSVPLDDTSQGLTRIDQQYKRDREHIIDECMTDMKRRIQKLNATRAAAIESLLRRVKASTRTNDPGGSGSVHDDVRTHSPHFDATPADAPTACPLRRSSDPAVIYPPNFDKTPIPNNMSSDNTVREQGQQPKMNLETDRGPEGSFFQDLGTPELMAQVLSIADDASKEAEQNAAHDMDAAVLQQKIAAIREPQNTSPVPSETHGQNLNGEQQHMVQPETVTNNTPKPHVPDQGMQPMFVADTFERQDPENSSSQLYEMSEQEIHTSSVHATDPAGQAAPTASMDVLTEPQLQNLIPPHLAGQLRSGQPELRMQTPFPVSDQCQLSLTDDYIERISSARSPVLPPNHESNDGPNASASLDLNASTVDDTFTGLHVDSQDQLEASLGTFEDDTQIRFDDAIYDHYAGYTPSKSHMIIAPLSNFIALLMYRTP
ncbi:hypothetical protein BRADI_1g56834v3 [Brachypodium distachyon]|uniref:Aminotransferase-like plant mobile domain-containing protein n=1 Tax=Brachypodium distachyon TaxID=15368 RepID=A0A0Q3NTK8_BRADI|nr:hypothetical protein BRADI_1g56834v3 [Brachypodium distachyon]